MNGSFSTLRNEGLTCLRKSIPGRALHKKSLFWDFSVQPLCPLCLCGVVLLGIHQPQRHRGHRGCTEKSAIETFCAKPSACAFCGLLLIRARWLDVLAGHASARVGIDHAFAAARWVSERAGWVRRRRSNRTRWVRIAARRCSARGRAIGAARGIYGLLGPVSSWVTKRTVK